MFASPSLIEARERAAILALMTRRILPRNRLAGAIEDEGSAISLLDRLDDPGDRLFNIESEKYTLDEMESYIHRLEDEGIHLVTVLDEDYPVNLQMVHDRPPALFYRGDLSAEDERSVAVVGTRRASGQGLEQARAVAAALIAQDYVIVSGLAEGIDTASHRAALDAGHRTAGVIGTGLRQAFPAANAALQDEIAERAVVISQFWPDQGPRKWTFPERNAVMSGFARATVVVEASKTSGARMQARLAREHGRPVFLLRSLLEHEWAQRTSDYPGVYVVDAGNEVADHLHRLYESDLELAR
jgi:DNA processing protein